MKVLPTFIAAASILFAAGSVSAQSFSPSSGGFTASGNVDLLQSSGAQCNVSLSGTVSSASHIAITGKTFSPGPNVLCGWAVTPFGAWHAETIPGNFNQLLIYMGANTIIGDKCHGWVVADVRNLPGGGSEITFENDELIDGTYPNGTPTGCYVLDGLVTTNVQLL